MSSSPRKVRCWFVQVPVQRQGPSLRQAEWNTGADKSESDRKACCGREFVAAQQEIGDEDLRADEHQHGCQRIFEVVKAVDHGGQRKVESAQPEDRHDVRCIDNKGVGGDRKDRRDRVYREHQISKVDDNQREKQRCCVRPAQRRKSVRHAALS